MWKKACGFSNYLCNENGEIYSIKKKKILKGSITNKGYKRVLLTKENGKTVQIRVHRLIAQTFLPNPENKPEVNHKDGNKTNNAVSNLEWVTTKENVQHAIKTGLNNNKGTKHPQASCTKEQVKEIKFLISKGKRDTEIERITGIPFYTVGRIRKGQHYKEV